MMETIQTMERPGFSKIDTMTYRSPGFLSSGSSLHGVGDPNLHVTPWGLPEWFVIVQVVGPAILFLPGTQPFRIPLRMGVFAIGLLGLVVSRRSGGDSHHPSAWLLVAAILYVALMIFHPATNTTLAGLAQTFLELAVVAPLFWTPRYFRGDMRRLARTLTILWIFNGASALVGILQVRDPGTWMPVEFSSVVKGGRFGLAVVKYRGDDGQMRVRPPGLGDAPGAACGAGLLVASMGLAYLGLPVSQFRRVLGACGIMVGVTVIFLSHIRSSLLMFLGSAVVYVVILAMQKRMATAFGLLAAIAGTGFGSLIYAYSLGGQSIINRFATLVDADPLTVYDRSARMGMVTHAFDTLLVEYPLGAGLGRFGMMRGYFGDENNLDSPVIWAEVQLPAWIIEGGIVLLSLYLIAIAIAIARLLRITLRHRSPGVRQWAGAILMLSASPVALMFSYCPFHAQMGMQFWFLIGAMEGVADDRSWPPPARRPSSAR